MEHGNEAALGFRFGPAAYAPDVSLMPEARKARLHGLDLLIIDALRETPHPTHYSVSDALALIETVRPRRAILTNLHTDLDYATLAAKLPPNVVPAYDGLSVTAGPLRAPEEGGPAAAPVRPQFWLPASCGRPALARSCAVAARARRS